MGLKSFDVWGMLAFIRELGILIHVVLPS
jgi:hypothetical protein